jgi:hypothetical protein
MQFGASLRRGTNVVATNSNVNVKPGTLGQIMETHVLAEKVVYKIVWLGYICSLVNSREEFSIIDADDSLTTTIKLFHDSVHESIVKRNRRELSHKAEVNKIWSDFIHVNKYKWDLNYEPICNAFEQECDEKHSQHAAYLDSLRMKEDLSNDVIVAGSLVYSFEPSNSEFGRRGTVIEQVCNKAGETKFKVLWDGYHCSLYYFRRELVVEPATSKSCLISKAHMTQQNSNKRKFTEQL